MTHVELYEIFMDEMCSSAAGESRFCLSLLPRRSSLWFVDIKSA